VRGVSIQESVCKLERIADVNVVKQAQNQLMVSKCESRSVFIQLVSPKGVCGSSLAGRFVQVMIDVDPDSRRSGAI